jgi:O-antigen/teichoic acid export membrane protein
MTTANSLPIQPHATAPYRRIAKRISRTARWAMVESIVSAAASLLTVIALAHFLVPAEFGRAGLAVAVAAIVQALLLGGQPDALVRVPSAHTGLTDAAFWSMLGLGGVASLLCLIAALFVATVLGDRGLAELIAVQGLTGIALGAAAAPTGILLRKMRTRALVARTGIAKLVGLAVSVLLAWHGFGAWAMVLGNIAAQTAGAVQLLATMRTPRLRLRDPGLVPTLRLGLLSGMQSGLGTLTTRGFILAFGAVYGAHAVGLFNFALRLVEESCGLVVTTVRRVTVTSFAAAKRTGIDSRAMFMRGTSVIAYVAAPLFLGGAAVAPDMVQLLFGAKWIGAVPVLQLMLAMWVVRSTRMLINAVMLVEGRQAVMVRLGLLGLIATAVAFAMSLPFGVVATTAAYAATLVGSVFGARSFAAATGITVAAQLRAGARPIGFALAMAGVVTALRLGPLADTPLLARLLLTIVIGAAFFTCLAWRFDRAGFADLIRTLRR